MASFKRFVRQGTNAVFRFMRSRAYIATGLLCCVAGVMFYITGSAKTVYIRDGETITLRYTFQEEPTEILGECGITLMAFDAVDFTGFSGKVGEINITRGYPVYLTYDGVTQKVMAAGHTLGEVLESEGLRMGPYDELSHHTDYQLRPDDEIKLSRVQVTTQTTQTVVPYDTQYRQTSLLKPGRTTVLVQGQTGLLETTITQRIVDGVVEEETVVGEHVVRRAVDQVILTGASGAPISNLDFGIQLDAHGKPVNYKAVYTNQVATGYNAGRGAWGASGMTLEAGYVAVRAADIPYGTKLYITSADGSFVYGCAIAADTGTALVQNIIDVDLYYDTYLESCLNGRRDVQIYVLS